MRRRERLEKKPDRRPRERSRKGNAGGISDAPPGKAGKEAG